MTRIGRLLFCLSLLAALAAGAPSRSRAEDTGQIMSSAMKLYEQGNYKRALKLFLNVLRVEPNNAQAREYMMHCSDKIVEQELGVRTQTAGSDLPAPTSPNSVSGPAPARSLRGLRRGPPAVRRAAEEKDKKPKGLTFPSDRPTAKDLVSQQESLTEDYRRRVLGKEGPVWVESHRSQLEVVVYMNRLFLPMTEVLAPDAYPVLDAAVAEIRANPGKSVLLRTVDNMSPAVRHSMLDLPARRTVSIYTYFMQSTFAPVTGDGATLTAADLAD